MTDGLQSAIGLDITKYDRAGLQITIGFGLQSATKIKKNWITKCDGIANRDRLQSDTVQSSPREPYTISLLSHCHL